MLTPDYPQFVQVEPPADGLTISAWRGTLKPFSSDAAARSILCDMEAELMLWVWEGSIRPGESICQHWAHPLLIGMETVCDVLVCTQTDAMPRAYLLNPRFQLFYADTMIHPHPRADQTIIYEGIVLPGLCVFSSAELTFSEETNFYTQFLDQLTQYIAKHLIWLRTRRLCRRSGDVTSVLYQPRPGELIVEKAPVAHSVQLPTGKIRVIDYWSGYWPGKAAKAITPSEHVRKIKPSQRCWCGLNKRYGDCHRTVDIKLSMAARRDSNCL
jgi:hypothetical protein